MTTSAFGVVHKATLFSTTGRAYKEGFAAGHAGKLIPKGKIGNKKRVLGYARGQEQKAREMYGTRRIANA